MITTVFTVVLILFYRNEAPKPIVMFENLAECQKVLDIYKNDKSLPDAYLRCEPMSKAN